MAISELLGKALLPGKVGESRGVSARASRYGDQYVQPIGKARCALALEGSYFIATNPTPGTGVAGIAATGAFADTESLIHIHNTNSAASGKVLVLDYIKLQVTAAGTNGTDHRFVSKIDEGDRYTSGGSAITPVSPASDVANGDTNATVEFGALVTAAATANARLVGNGLIRNVIAVAGDQYLFDFGGDPSAGAGHAVAGTAIANLVINHAPVVLGPDDVFVMSLHAASQTAATSYEFEIGWWER